MVKITERDRNIKEFLSSVVVADTHTIHQLFFKNTTMRNCQKRLKQLTEIRYIKVYRENILSQNVYYTKTRPKNIPHKIKFSQLLAELDRQNIEVLKYKTPFVVGSVIADGLIIVKDRGKIKMYFVEAERTKKLNVDKYADMYYSRAWKEKLPNMPRILVITDKNVATSEVLDIRSCKWDLSNLKI